MKDYYTYAYLREDGSPYYVGKGRGRRVFDKHRGSNPPRPNRIMFLREGMTEEQAIGHEIEIIKTWGRKDLGTGMLRNLTNGGEGISGHKYSKESRAKMSLAQKGRIFSEESKARMSLARTGKKHTEETKAKLSVLKMGNQGRLGIRHTKESKIKMSLAQIARRLSENLS